MDMKSLVAGLAMGAAASFGVAVTAAPGDAIFETVEQVEALSEAQQIALGEFVTAIFALPVDTMHGLSCVRTEAVEGEPAKISCAARVYKTANPAELLEAIDAGKVGRVVGRVQ